MSAQQEQLNIFQRKARDWAALVVKLHNTRVPTQFESKKRALLSSAKTIKNMVEKVAGPIKELATMNNLGAVPAVLLVVVVAAGTAIYKWTIDYKKFMTEIGEVDKLVAGGVSRDKAYEIIQGKEDAKTYKKYIYPALGVIAAFVGLKAFQIYKGR